MMRDADRFRYKVFLLRDGKIVSAKYHREHWGSQFFLCDGETDYEFDEHMLLDETPFEDSLKGILDFWQKEKDDFSVHHHAEFYFFTKIKKLEHKLDSLQETLANFTKTLSRLS